MSLCIEYILVLIWFKEIVLGTGEMSRALVIWSALFVCVSMVYAGKNYGKGVWETLAINKCEEDNHKFKFDIELLKKINETHDGFKGHIVLDEDFDEAYGIRLQMCKIVDDNCKNKQVLVDDCLIDFFYKYAKDSVTACLQAASLDPAEIPIPKGAYDIERFVFSNEPTVSMFGKYKFNVFVLQGDEEVGCLETIMEFQKIEEDDEEE